MRVTNGMIRNTSLNSLYNNMSKLDTLFNQMNTLKKIQRPSDDPIIAGRSMKLKLNVLETEQYKSNVDESTAWMGITETAINNVTKILEDIRTRSNQAANGLLEADDIAKIKSDIEQLVNQLKQEANVTYAGRYVFSGFKTNKPLFLDDKMTLGAASDELKNINEYLKGKDLALGGDVTLGGAMDLGGDLTLGGSVTAGGPITVNGGADTSTGEIKIGGGDVNLGGTLTLGKDATFTVDLSDTSTPPKVYPAGTTIPKGTVLAPATLPEGSTIPAGSQLENDIVVLEGSVIGAGTTINGVLPENTVLGAGNTLPSKTPPITIPAGTTLGKGNLNPQVLGQIKDHNINYEIGVGTTVNVNTLGMDTFMADILKDFNSISEKLNSNLTSKELSEFFSGKIGDFDKHLSTASEKLADLGSRQKRLEYTETRLTDDKANFTELLTKTEDVDLEEVYVDFNTQYTIYTSALQATSKVMMNSLADFLR